ncbi:MAG TPA: LuxR family transcriptional regulator [Pseudolabrys sp.]|nr:LuxR family transcriptional regulator [Pseudolabrys sp.]
MSEVESVRSMAELRPFISRMLERYGLRHAVYLAVTLPNHIEPHPVLVSTYPEQWAQRYVEQDYLAIDPVIGAAATGLLPFDWSELSHRGIRVKQMFNESQEFGIGQHGLGFPVRGPLGDQALFSVTSNASAGDWQKLRSSYMRDLQLLAHFVHGKVLEFERGATFPIKPLSAREREVLSWAARGLNNDQIAFKLGISERVVRAYFESARHKLNCLNRSHVLARAVSLRLVGPTSLQG